MSRWRGCAEGEPGHRAVSVLAGAAELGSSCSTFTLPVVLPLCPLPPLLVFPRNVNLLALEFVPWLGIGELGGTENMKVA